MKKIMISCGVAIAAIGFYTGAFGENNSYVQPKYDVIASDMQDTLPGRKKDTTNRRPLPQDTTRRDSGLVHLNAVIK